MKYKKNIIFVIIAILLLIVFFNITFIERLFIGMALEDRNERQFKKWYKNKYLPSHYKGFVTMKKDFGGGDIWLGVYDITNLESLSYRIMKESNEKLFKNIFLNDTIEKDSGRNRIYLIEDGKQIDSFEIKFKYEH